MNGFRNRWKKGDFLIIDSESGMTRYSSQVGRDYTGEMVTRRHVDSEQPQDFIKPSSDPKPIPFSNPGLSDFSVDTCTPPFVGETGVVTPFGSVNHMFLCDTDAGNILTFDNGNTITFDNGDVVILG